MQVTLGIIIREVGQQITQSRTTSSQSGTQWVDLLPISFYYRYMSNKLSNMITLEFTVEEARAYADALNRATDNPFIQDDDDCSPLFTLLGTLEAEIDTVLDPIK